MKFLIWNINTEFLHCRNSGVFNLTLNKIEKQVKANWVLPLNKIIKLFFKLIDLNFLIQPISREYKLFKKAITVNNNSSISFLFF